MCSNNGLAHSRLKLGQGGQVLDTKDCRADCSGHDHPICANGAKFVRFLVVESNYNFFGVSLIDLSHTSIGSHLERELRCDIDNEQVLHAPPRPFSRRR